MKLPFLKKLPSAETMMIEFKGLNKSIAAQSNNLIDCENISLKYHPKLTTRPSREVLYQDIINPKAILKSKEIYYVANGGFYANGVLKFSGLSNTSKSMVKFHSKICIFPDKKYYDESNETNGNIGNGSVYPAVGGCPDLDYVCVHNNRVWGVKKSSIYGCALGNVQDWTTFVDVDGNPSEIGAYAVDVASPGDFTGCIEYQNHVVALKENYHHELYGQKPSNFTVVEVSKTGTISYNSMVEVSSILYFLNSLGVMRYGGGQASNISLDLNETYINGVMGGDGRFLYLSLYNGSDYDLYVYDMSKAIWWREDDLRVVDFFNDGDIVYALTWDGYVYQFNSGTETNINWSFTISDLAEIGSTKKKNVKVILSLYTEYDSEIEIFVSEDRKPFRSIAQYRFDNNVVKSIPLSINAVSEFKLKVQGDKYVEVYNIEKNIVGGGTVWH